ncbi:MAG: hypothetical protein ABIQ04_03900 [Candidatus Saccharimonadales bacterium]
MYLYRHGYDHIKFVAAATTDSNMRENASQYAVGTFLDKPDALRTLRNTGVLEGDLGAIVTNATIFAIAATTTYYIKGTKLFGGGVISFKTENGEKPFKPTMAWGDYIAYMEKNHPDATAVARHIRVGATKKANENVIAVMGYLIEQGIINEQLIINSYK